MKRVLMLTAKEEDIPFILQAQMLGYYVISTGNAPSQPGHKYADEYIPFDYSDYEGITNLARELNIEGVLHGCSDNCALTAAYICEKLGLKGHDSFAVTEIIHRKDMFKQFAKANNIKTPMADSYSKDQISVALENKGNLAYPVIVKPGDLAGGQGVSVVCCETDYERAINNAFARSNSKNIVVEPFIDGSIHSLHVFLVNQSVRAYGTANDYSYLNKYMTSYGVFPADDWERVTKILIPEIERIASLLQLVDGQMDIQYIMKGREVWIMEMMRRNPGNHTTGVIANSIGLNWREWIVRAETGSDVQNMPKSNLPQNYYGYYCVMSARNGVFKRIIVSESIKKYIIETKDYVDSGYVIRNYLYDKLAIIFFCFMTEEEKEEVLPQISSLITVELE